MCLLELRGPHNDFVMTGICVAGFWDLQAHVYSCIKSDDETSVRSVEDQIASC